METIPGITDDTILLVALLVIVYLAACYILPKIAAFNRLPKDD